MNYMVTEIGKDSSKSKHTMIQSKINLSMGITNRTNVCMHPWIKKAWKTYNDIFWHL